MMMLKNGQIKKACNLDYRDADVALITPLRDGMNLVAKGRLV